MSQWPMVSLGEVLRLDLDRVNIDPSAEYSMVGVLSFGRGLFDREPITNGKTSYKFFYRLKADHLVMSQLFGWEGALALSSESFAGKFVSPQFPTFLCNTDRLDRRFLGWVTQLPSLWNDLGSRASGMGDRRRTLTPDALFKCVIPLPPLPEQRRLVERIDALAAKIAEAKKLRETADKQRHQLTHHAADSLFRNCVWPYVPLANLLIEDSRNGIGTRPNDEPPGVQILRISAGTSRADAVVDERDHKYLPVTKKQLELYRLKKDDLLACRFNGNLRYVGRFSIYRHESGQEQVYPDKLIRFRVDHTRVLPEFVKLAMNSPTGRERIEAFCATTAGNIGISASELKTVPVPVPPLGVQEDVIAYLHCLQGSVTEADAGAKELGLEINAMLPAVLDRAFRGEL